MASSRTGLPLTNKIVAKPAQSSVKEREQPKHVWVISKTARMAMHCDCETNLAEQTHLQIQKSINHQTRRS